MPKMVEAVMKFWRCLGLLEKRGGRGVEGGGGEGKNITW